MFSTLVSSLVADVSVRQAHPGDVGDIARIQLEAWRVGYASILPEATLTALSVDAAQAAWTLAVTNPPTSKHRVLVAQEQHWVVGFVAVIPADDFEPGDPQPDSTAAIGPLLVQPRWGRRGHGSRLLAAAVEYARDDAMTRAIAWLPEADTASRGLFDAAGWSADGYVRGLDTGAGQLREVRYHVSLGE